MAKKNREIHIRLDAESYDKLRHITFYERVTLSEILRRLINEYLEEKALEEQDYVTPHQL
ncbi:MAG TPA: ribbon-helix-helix protein, CopG family [Bacillota bacterium]|nr:ribbon-helix-helix protein, CopG family [Bacillota bacterium]